MSDAVKCRLCDQLWPCEVHRGHLPADVDPLMPGLQAYLDELQGRG